ncbi:MAG: type II/IV secretion system ATPase subunit [Methanomassiliicoccales archaeon]|nr:MAG: type II/IV secretion system ATPase subunit [Methanomassiliicoccales archaeon]
MSILNADRHPGTDIENNNRIRLPKRIYGQKAETQAPMSPLGQKEFSYSLVDPSIPPGSKIIDDITKSGARIRIFSTIDGGHLYHIVPSEFMLPKEEKDLVISSISHVRSSPPPSLDISVPELRRYVWTIANESLVPRCTRGRAEQLADVVVRYTVGLGILEHLLNDDRVEDIYLDAPCSENRWHVTIAGLAGERHTLRASTNISSQEQEAIGLISRLKQHCLRPFSEAVPVLETDVPGFDARATVMGPPLSPHGVAMAFRRHSKRPWTLLRLMALGCLDAETAGLLSFLIDGRASILVCGPRGAGKSSLLSALMFEFPTSQRIIVIEDTLELPVRQMQGLGFKVQSIQVQPGIDRSVEEASEDALRVSLRLGESALVLGEVRGSEARTLYESMRTGKAGSSVLGTIHGDSARSVYERAVHDLGVAPEAFSATDFIATLGLIRPNGAQKQERRLVELAEVRKSSGPGEFEQLLHSQRGSFALSLERSEVVEKIAKDWGITYQQALDNIKLRAQMRLEMVKAQRSSVKDLLGPETVQRCNNFLWKKMAERSLDPEEVIEEFERELEGWC